MSRIYLNTFLLLELAICFGMIAFVILVDTGLYTWNNNTLDAVVTLDGPFETIDLVFQYEPTNLLFDLEAGNGCLASDLNILASRGGCVRNYCRGDHSIDGIRHVLEAGRGCTFNGVLRFVGAGTVLRT